MKRKYCLLILVACLIGLAGCATQPVVSELPEPRPLAKELPTFQPADEPDTDTPPPTAEEAEEGLSLRKALALALLHNPELAGYAWEVRVKEAEALQAGLFPNPEFEVEVEEVGGSGDRSGFDAAEVTFQISQLIELGGKREKRRRLAAIDGRLAGWDYEAARLDVITEVRKSFVEVLAAQERLALADDKVHLSEEVLNTVSEQVRVGKESPLEETRAGVTLSTSRIERDKARRNLQIARSRLESMWGDAEVIFPKVIGNLETSARAPSLEDIREQIVQNPDVARWASEMEQRRAKVDLEEAHRIPDVTVGAGPQWFNETDDTAFALGVSIPLPINDRNQGGRLAAHRALQKAHEERRAAQLRVQANLTESHEALLAAQEELDALKSEVLPQAQDALNLVREGYKLGKFGYLEVLDSQRALFEARGLRIESLLEYQTAVAELERLIGMPLDEVGQMPAAEQEEAK